MRDEAIEWEGGALVNPNADVHPNATIGKGTRVHAFAYIEGDVTIGEGCVIKPHAFICAGVRIGDSVFIGPGVVFTNDKEPRANNPEFQPERTFVGNHARIGANATILPGLTIGVGALIGAGAVVTRNVPPNETVYGNPAKNALQDVLGAMGGPTS